MVQAPEEEALSGGALPPDWEEANGPTGLYYYNTRTQETSWTRPEGGGLTDEELAGSAADNITADAPPRARRSLNLRKACCTCLCVLGILLGLVVIGLGSFVYGWILLHHMPAPVPLTNQTSMTHHNDSIAVPANDSIAIPANDSIAIPAGVASNASGVSFFSLPALVTPWEATYSRELDLVIWLPLLLSLPIVLLLARRRRALR